MNRSRIEAACLGAIALLMLPTGLQAALLPRSFYDDFPLGRGWISAGGGAYDEHLVRDVGVLFLALIVLTVWAIPRRQMATPVAVAWLVQGIPHLVFHIGHLDGLDGVDQVAMVVSLATIPALAAVTVWAGRDRPGAASASPT